MSKRIWVALLTANISLTVLGATYRGNAGQNDTIYRKLEGINVTADPTSNSIKSTTPVQKLDEEKIRQTGVTDIADAMRRMSGVNLRDYGGSGASKTISIRGMGASHTGVVYDGAVISDMQTGQIDLSRYSIENIESLILNIADSDDIFVPARTASSAALLTINSLNKAEMDNSLPRVNAKFKAASFQTFNPFLKFSKSNGKNIAFSLTGEYLFSKNDYPFILYNGVQTEKERRSNSRINTKHFDGLIEWHPKEDHALRIKGYYYDNNRLLPGPVIYYASPSNEKLRERNSFGHVDYQGTISEKVKLNALAKYNWSSSRYLDINGRYPGGKLDDYYIQNEEYVSASLLYTPARHWNFSYSADWFRNYLHDNSNETYNPIRNSVLQTLSAQFRNKRLRITARALMSMIYDKRDEGKTISTKRLSPSASVSYRLLANHNLNARFGYKNIFRMPSFNELYFRHYGTIELKPEITDQLNLGLTYAKGGIGAVENLNFSIDGFLNHIKDKIVAVPFNMFLWSMTNMGKVRATGFDINLSVYVNIGRRNYLDFTGNYSFIRNVARTDKNYPDWNKQLPYSPVNSGAWNLTWVNPWVNFVIHGYGCSARYANATNQTETRMSGYMELGVTFYRDFHYRKSIWEIRGDILNLFNRQYEIVRRYPMPGRSFSITIGYKLNY